MILTLSKLNYLLASLTPYERFEAMRKMDQETSPGTLHELLTNKWFVLLGWSCIVLLSLVLAALRNQRNQKKRLQDLKEFEERSEEFKLTREEQEVAYLIAKRAKVEILNMIFEQQAAYEKGAARYLQKTLASCPDEKTRKQLTAAIERIREKIGFVKQAASFGGRSGSGRSVTSRQITPDTEVIVFYEAVGGKESIPGQVISNEEGALAVKLGEARSWKAGQTCMIHCRMGSVTWGFEMIILICEQDRLECSHTDNAEYINRRKFDRVPVTMPGWITSFPTIHNSELPVPEKPDFVSAEILELSGTGLCVRSELETALRERVLIVFRMDNGQIVQDIAEVRRIHETETERTIALELIGLDDRSEEELILITNRYAAEHGVVSDQAGPEGQEADSIPTEANEKETEGVVSADAGEQDAEDAVPADVSEQESKDAVPEEVKVS